MSNGRNTALMRGWEQGQVTVVMAAAAAACVAIVGMVALVGQVFVAKAQAQAAADMAALGAAHVQVGYRSDSMPCAQAATVARSNGASLSGCSIANMDVTVRVERSIAGFRISATARAGPIGGEGATP